MVRKAKQGRDQPENRDKVLRCSFCNKSQRDVMKLIAGPSVHICDECVDICVNIIAEDFKEQRAKRLAGGPLLEVGAPGDCTFCGIRMAPLELPKGTVICIRCLGAIHGKAIRQSAP